MRAVACASTGDTSAALAAYAAAAGLPAIVILPRGKVTAAQLVQPLANGARVLALDTDFDGCMAIVKRLVEEDGVYLANSMNSLRIEGQKTVAIEIVQQFDWEVPDVIVIPGGNLGNVSALGAGFDMMLDLGLIAKRPRIVVAQAAAANPLYAAYQNNWAFEPVTAQPTIASAIQIGNPVSFDKAVRTLQRYDGIVEQATETELADAAARADRTGHVQLPAHRRRARGAREARRAGRGARSRDRVIVISTANGLKFTEFKVAYHTRHAGRGDAALPQPPGGAARQLRRGAARDRRAGRARGRGLTERHDVSARDSVRGSGSVEVRRRVAGRRARRSSARRG